MKTHTVALPFTGAITIENNGSLLPFCRPELKRTSAGELTLCAGKVKLYLTRSAAYQRAV